MKTHRLASLRDSSKQEKDPCSDKAEGEDLSSDLHVCAMHIHTSTSHTHTPHTKQKGKLSESTAN